MRKRRVLSVIHELLPGGIETWLATTAPGLRDRGWELDILCTGSPDGPMRERFEQVGSEVRNLPLRYPLRFVERLTSLLRDERYDVVHVNRELYAGLIVLAARRAATPTVVSFHSTSFPVQLLATPLARFARAALGSWSVPYAVRHADVVTGCSQAVLDAIVTPRRREARVLHLGTASPEKPCAERQMARRVIGLEDDDELIVGSIGGLRRQKGFDHLLEAFAATVGHVERPIRLVIVGDGPLRGELEALAQSLGIESRVTFTGRVAGAGALCSAFDVFALGSRHEGFGLVFLEAAARGVPVVGLDVDGVREAVVDGETGLLVDPRRRDAFAGALAELLVDEAARRQMGHRARARHLSNFTVDHAVQRLAQAFHDSSR